MIFNYFKPKKNKSVTLFIEPTTVTAAIIIGTAAISGIIAFFSNALDDLAISVFQGLIFLVTIITQLITKIIGYFVVLAYSLFDFFLKLNFTIRDNKFIEFGWSITRDIANLFFIIIIIIIALATILRIKDYSAKQLLAKIIIIIILINFSLEIGFLLVDFTNILASFLLNEAKIENLSEHFTSILNPQKFSKAFEYVESKKDKIIEKDENNVKDVKPIITVFMNVILVSTFSIIFNILILFVFLVYAILMLTRYISISILLILLPGALMLQFIPQFKNLNNEWYQKFFSWSFFLPIITFFLYLSIKSTEFINFDFDYSLYKHDESEEFDFQDILFNIFKTGGNLIISLSLLIYGLIISQKLGMEFAGKALNFAKEKGQKFKKASIEKSKELSKRAISKPFANARIQKIGEKMQGLGKDSGFILRTLSSPIRKIGNAIGSAKTYREGLVNKEKEKLKNKSLENQASMFDSANTPEKIAILENVADKGTKLNQEKRKNDSEIQKTQNNINNLNNQEQKLETALLNPKLTESERIDFSLKLDEIRVKIDTEKNNLNNLQKEKAKIENEINKFNDTILSRLPNYIKDALKNSDFNMSNLANEIEKITSSSFKGKIKQRPLTKNDLNSYIS